MQPIHIQCFNRAEVPRHLEPVSVGVPIPSGISRVQEQFILRDGEGQAVTLQTQALNRWPDGSIKWLLCDFFSSTPAVGQSCYSLEYKDQFVPQPDACVIKNTDDGLQIETGSMMIVAPGQNNRGLFSVFTADRYAPIVSEAVLRLYDLAGNEWPFTIKQATVEVSGPVRTTLAIEGQCVGLDGRQILVQVRLHLYTGLSVGTLELRLHNPGAARHPGNLWDLGDPGSILFKEWLLELNLAGKLDNAFIHPTANAPACALFQGQGTIYQEASGGVHWQSPVHRNRDGTVPMREPGWVLTTGTHRESGHRAQPILVADVGGRRSAVSIDHFWERFPKSLASTQDTLLLGLLPGSFPGGHELQGGEQITESVRFDFAGQELPTFVAGPAILALCESHSVGAAQVFPEGLWAPTHSRYIELLALARGPKGFFAKREQVDEFGWRNFGELYADHETALNSEKQIFVSHYNNQYDPLASFYKLALATNDNGWLELAHNLAAHVADIDINHTDLDREEYCHGLFWHTDHYLDAGLSTHRMASREHLTHKNPAFCGGGPAAEHCYTTGLTLHHLLTGDPRSRQLVLKLADWCYLSLQGPQTLGAVLLRALKNAKRLRSERQTLWPRFPLSRGTGNCLNATLDAFELTCEQRYLVRAAQLIQGTVHPGDDVSERQLLNAETCWSYTVFFAAVGRYLATKELWEQYDGDFSHARQSLLTYARWMVDHEYPYLEKPEKLEYPNETWAGQDLRKGVVLYFAAVQAGDEERKRYLEKSIFFFDYGLDELYHRLTCHYTRPLALVMQNCWASEAARCAAPPCKVNGLPNPNGGPTHRLSLRDYFLRTSGDLAKTLLQIDLKREWSWLKSRLIKG